MLLRRAIRRPVLTEPRRSVVTEPRRVRGVTPPLAPAAAAAAPPLPPPLLPTGADWCRAVFAAAAAPSAPSLLSVALPDCAAVRGAPFCSELCLADAAVTPRDTTPCWIDARRAGLLLLLFVRRPFSGLVKCPRPLSRSGVALPSPPPLPADSDALECSLINPRPSSASSCSGSGSGSFVQGNARSR
jgi:hypothetical protein